LGNTDTFSTRRSVLAGERIEPGQLVDLVAEQANPEGVLLVRRHDLDDVAAHAESAAAELDVVAFVLDLDQLAQDVVALDALPFLERQHHPVVRLGEPGRRCTTRWRR
jgi:hypothetical protein